MTYCLAAVRSQCSLSRQPNPYWDAPRKVSCCRWSAAWARALAALPAVLGRAERCERSADLVSSASERSTAASLRACSSTSMKITLAAASIRPLCREAAGLPDARAVRRRHDLVPAPVPQRDSSGSGHSSSCRHGPLADTAQQLSDPPITLGLSPEEEVIRMGKPSKAALSKAGSTLASDSSSKAAKSKAGSTLGKG